MLVIVLFFASLVLISQGVTMEGFLGTMLILWVFLKFLTRQRSKEVNELTIFVHDGEEQPDEKKHFQGKLENRNIRFPAIGKRPRFEVIDGGKK